MRDAATRDAARGREIRAARAQALARRGEGAAATAGAADPFLVCACGEDRFGLPLGSVVRVLPGRPSTPVPGAMPALTGLVALSGRIVGVIDLGRALDRPGAAASAGHLVLLRGEPPVALAVDRALGIARSARDRAVSADGADGAPLGNGAASVYVPAADGSPDFVIVDPSQLLRRLLL